MPPAYLWLTTEWGESVFVFEGPFRPHGLRCHGSDKGNIPRLKGHNRSRCQGRRSRPASRCPVRTARHDVAPAVQATFCNNICIALVSLPGPIAPLDILDRLHRTLLQCPAPGIQVRRMDLRRVDNDEEPLLRHAVDAGRRQQCNRDPGPDQHLDACDPDHVQGRRHQRPGGSISPHGTTVSRPTMPRFRPPTLRPRPSSSIKGK